MTYLITFLILSVLNAFPAGGLEITQGDVNALHMPFSLEALLERFQEVESVDSVLVIKKTIEVMEAFYSYDTTKKELGLITAERNNLRTIYKLNIKRQKQAAIEDEQVLKSHNAVLAKEISLLRKKSECRASILKILDLCVIKVRIK